MNYIKLFLSLGTLAICSQSSDLLGKPKTTTAKKETKVVRELTTLAEYKKTINGKKPVIVKLHADWCSACKSTAPDFEAVAKKYQDRVIFLSLNIDNSEFESIRDEYVTEGVPTTLYIKNGIVINTLAGGYPKNELEKEVEKFLATKEKAPEPKKPVKKAAPKKKVEEVKEVATPKKSCPAPAPSKTNKATSVETLAEYNKLIAGKKPVFVELSADWCGACKMFDPIFTEVAEKYADQAQFLKIDVDNKEFATLNKTHGQEGIPATLFIKDGKVVDSRVGAYPKSAFDTIGSNFIKSGTTGLSTVQAKPQEKIQRTSKPTKKQTRTNKKK